MFLTIPALAPLVHRVYPGMTTTLSGATTSSLEIGLGSARGGGDGVTRAATTAAPRLHGATPHLALVITASPAGDAMAEARGVLGRIQVAGGASALLLTDDGPMKSGALVVCVANADGAASGVAATTGRDLADAGQAAARLVLSGWPFRARYPRGLGIAFARSDSGDSALRFLDSWRDFMGPKMRTVCGVLGSPVLYGGGQGNAVRRLAGRGRGGVRAWCPARGRAGRPRDRCHRRLAPQRSSARLILGARRAPVEPDLPQQTRPRHRAHARDALRARGGDRVVVVDAVHADHFPDAAREQPRRHRAGHPARDPAAAKRRVRELVHHEDLSRPETDEARDTAETPTLAKACSARHGGPAGGRGPGREQAETRPA